MRGKGVWAGGGERGREESRGGMHNHTHGARATQHPHAHRHPRRHRARKIGVEVQNSFKKPQEVRSLRWSEGVGGG